MELKAFDVAAHYEDIEESKYQWAYDTISKFHKLVYEEEYYELPPKYRRILAEAIDFMKQYPSPNAQKLAKHGQYLHDITQDLVLIEYHLDDVKTKRIY